MRLQRSLAEHGYACRSTNYPTVSSGIDAAARMVADHARELAAEYDTDRVHVVAHSLGGLVLRTAIARHGLVDQVAAAVTIGTPHGGCPQPPALVGHLPAVGRLLADIRAGSPFLAALDQQTRSCPGTTWTALYSQADWTVPGAAGRLEHPALNASNVEVDDVGHLGLIFSPAVIAEVRTALGAAEQAGARTSRP